MTLKRVLKIASVPVLGIVALVFLYFIAAFSFSRIAVASEVVKEDDSDVTIFILTNGVHTDIVVPVKADTMDWSKYVSFSNTMAQDTSAKWLAFGWGDKGFYLETPTWADLRFSVAYKAALGLGSSAIHATYYRAIKENKNCRPIKISKDQYKRLIAYIQNSFVVDEQGIPVVIKTSNNYGAYDAFYEANGKYSLFHTCNTWANNSLKSCGQKAGWWTPFDKGIFYHYSKKE